MSNANVTERNNSEMEEEGVEASPPSTITRRNSSSSSSNNNNNNELESFPSPFSVFPALQRSESFIRRRVQKRQGQEDLLKKKKSISLNDGSDELNINNNPIDLDELEGEEEILRRHSNHGQYGILYTDNTRFRLYRREQLLAEIDSANKKGKEGHAEVLKTLRNARILVYIIDAKVCITLTDVVNGIRRTIGHVMRDQEYRNHPKNQKCLLYRDYDGRLFNLILISDYSNLSGPFKGNLESFSVLLATSLVTFLTRSLSCAFEVVTSDFRNAYLVLILGVVFIEEISLSWTNVALLVRGIPSISAYTFDTRFGTDWLRKLIILLFAVSSASTNQIFQKVCTMTGIIMTCSVLLANLGSRSWKYLHWAPVKGLSLFGNNMGTPLDPIIGYIAAIMTGICFPFLGHRQIESGGTAAIESVIRIAIVVATLFILSDYDEFQKLLVTGSEGCNQDYVNLFVGVWWAFSLIASLTILFIKDIKKDKEFDPFKRDNVFPNDEEPLLEEDHASPIGYKVPHLPEFPIDPSYAQKGLGDCCCCFHQIGIEYTFGLIIAVVVGVFICVAEL